MVPRSIAEGDFFAAGAVNDLTSGNLFLKVCLEVTMETLFQV